MTRGERNNNPGNLNYLPPASAYRGQIGLEVVPDGASFTPRFGVYDTAHNGIRALACQVRNDNTRHGKATIRQIIGSWAPAGDGNDTPAYIQAVADAIDVGPDDVIDATSETICFHITRAIINQENGEVVWDDDDILNAVQDALAS